MSDYLRHHDCEEAGMRVECEVCLGYIAGGHKHVGQIRHIGIGRRTVVINVPKLLRSHDQQLAPQVQRRQETARAGRIKLLIEVLAFFDLGGSGGERTL